MQTSSSRDPYGAAISAVKRFADAGRFVPGEPIVVTELAAEVGLSPTPIREALACLAGQGLIERRKGRGYFYPDLAPAEIIDLFELQLAYLHAALALYPRGLAPLRKAVSAVRPEDGLQALFEAIISQSANSALALAHRRLVDRLGPVLKMERERGAPDAPVWSAMAAAVREGRMADLLGLLETHHEQRCARVFTVAGQSGEPDPGQPAGEAGSTAPPRARAASAPAAAIRRS